MIDPSVFESVISGFSGIGASVVAASPIPAELAAQIVAVVDAMQEKGLIREWKLTYEILKLDTCAAKHIPGYTKRFGNKA